MEFPNYGICISTGTRGFRNWYANGSVNLNELEVKKVLIIPDLIFLSQRQIETAE